MCAVPQDAAPGTAAEAVQTPIIGVLCDRLRTIGSFSPAVVVVVVVVVLFLSRLICVRGTPHACLARCR